MMVGVRVRAPQKHISVEFPSKGMFADAIMGRGGHSTLGVVRAFSSSRQQCQVGGSSTSVPGASPASLQVVGK
jgi:hypothetical protein